MNRIWNSNLNDNFNIRKMATKDSFKIGEAVYGRVVKSIDVNEAIIKLINGLELHAKLEGLEGGINELDKGLIKFIVESFNDNKVQLKLFKAPEENSKTINNELLKFISAEGLNTEDAEVLKSMLKFDMTLTKEHIRDIKSLIQFKERISTNPSEVNNFIDKYLDSKNITANSLEGQSIKDKLTQFFSSFSTLDMDDILLFLENDIEFSKESIDSYKNMFKGNVDADNANDDNKDLNKMNLINGSDTDINKTEEGNNPKVSRSIHEVINNIKEQVKNLDLVTAKGIEKEASLQESNAATVSNEIDLNEQGITSTVTKGIDELFRGKNIELGSRELELLSKVITEDENQLIGKDKLEKVLSNLVGKEVTLSEKEYKDIYELVKVKEFNVKDAEMDALKLPKEIIKEAVTARAEEGKQIIKNVLELLSESMDSSDLLGIIKNNISDVKLFNKLSDQYYYVDVPLNFNEKEYPCKVIIKDKRKEGKAIDSQNVKLVVTLKTTNFGVVDSYVQVANRNITIKLSCNEQFTKIFDISKSKLENVIGALGYNVKVTVEKKVEEISLTTCREFFGDNNVAGIDIKV